MLSDLSDEEIEVNTGARLPPKLTVLERDVINIIFTLRGELLEESEEFKTLLLRHFLRELLEENISNLRGELLEDSEETDTLLLRLQRQLMEKYTRITNQRGELLEEFDETDTLLLRLLLIKLMEEKAAKAARIRANRLWSEDRGAALRSIIATSAESRRRALRTIKFSKVVQSYKSQSTSQVQSRVQGRESVRVEQIEHQWIDFQGEYQVSELQQETPQWLGYIQLPRPIEPVLLTPVENVQPQVVQAPVVQAPVVQEVREVRVIDKILEFEEFLDR